MKDVGFLMSINRRPSADNFSVRDLANTQLRQMAWELRRVPELDAQWCRQKICQFLRLQTNIQVKTVMFGVITSYKLGGKYAFFVFCIFFF